jgi:hypothetical protein
MHLIFHDLLVFLEDMGAFLNRKAFVIKSINKILDNDVVYIFGSLMLFILSQSFVWKIIKGVVLKFEVIIS